MLLAVSPFEDREIRAPYVMSGYFGNPEATAEAFTADGLLRTGDLGRRRPDGNLAAVVPVDHPTFQDVGFAFVEPRPGMVVTAEALRDYLKDRIANYKAPKTFEIRGELPKLPNSKIDKLSLRAAAALSRATWRNAAGYEVDVGAVAPPPELPIET